MAEPYVLLCHPSRPRQTYTCCDDRKWRRGLTEVAPSQNKWLLQFIGALLHWWSERSKDQVQPTRRCSDP